MANSEFLEVISEQGLKDIQQAIDLTAKLAKQITDINNLKASSTPSGADNNIDKVNKSYNEQNDLSIYFP